MFVVFLKSMNILHSGWKICLWLPYMYSFIQWLLRCWTCCMSWYCFLEQGMRVPAVMEFTFWWNYLLKYLGNKRLDGFRWFCGFRHPQGLLNLSHNPPSKNLNVKTLILFISVHPKNIPVCVYIYLKGGLLHFINSETFKIKLIFILDYNAAITIYMN